MTAHPTMPSARDRCSTAAPSAYPTSFSNYPSNFNTFGGEIPTGIWYWTPEQLAAYNSPANVNRDPVTRVVLSVPVPGARKGHGGLRAGGFQGRQLGGERRAALRAHRRRCAHLHRRSTRPRPARSRLRPSDRSSASETQTHLQRRAAEREPEIRLEPGPGRAIRSGRDHDACRITPRSAGFTNLSPPGSS